MLVPKLRLGTRCNPKLCFACVYRNRVSRPLRSQMKFGTELKGLIQVISRWSDSLSEGFSHEEVPSILAETRSKKATKRNMEISKNKYSVLKISNSNSKDPTPIMCSLAFFRFCCLDCISTCCLDHLSFIFSRNGMPHFALVGEP